MIRWLFRGRCSIVDIGSPCVLWNENCSYCSQSDNMDAWVLHTSGTNGRGVDSLSDCAFGESGYPLPALRVEKW